MSVTFRNTSKQIVLRSPEFSDGYHLLTNLSVKTMMDGSATTHRNRGRRVFKLTFTELTRVKAEELRDFVATEAGKRVFFDDHYGVNHTGYILDTELVLTNQGKGRSSGAGIRAEAFSTTLEFEVADANADS